LLPARLGSLQAAAAEEEVKDGEEEDVPLLVFVSVVLLVLESAMVVPGLVPVSVSLLSLVELLLVFVSVPVLASKLVSPLVFDLVPEVDEAFEAPASEEELPVPVEDLEPDLLAVLLSASAGDFTPELLGGSLVGFESELEGLGFGVGVPSPLLVFDGLWVLEASLLSFVGLGFSVFTGADVGIFLGGVLVFEGFAFVFDFFGGLGIGGAPE
jgi:hypothetical protein